MRLLRIGGRFLDQALRRAGHEVVPAGGEAPDASSGAGTAPRTPFDPFRDPEGARARLAEAVEASAPDWILQVDDSTPLAHLGLERFPVRKAWYAVDSHLHAWHPHYAAHFDRVFCAQRNQLERLGARQGAVSWLPLCFTGDPAFLPWADRVHGIAFIGTLDPALNPSRIALLEGVAALGLEVHAAQGDYASVYTRSRVVINQAASDDLNFRVFEAMGCGALLLTDRISHSLEAIGEPGRDFLVYEPGDAEDLARQARWALEHPAEAEAMARRGHLRVLERHLVGHRVAALEKELAAAPAPEPAASSRAGAARRAMALSHLAAALEHISRLDLPGELAKSFARDARRTAGDALAADPSAPWALLVLSQLELEAGRTGPALAFLDAIHGVPAEAEYRRRYLLLLALLRAFAGRLPEARQALEEGLREFPGDGEFGRIRDVLGAGAPRPTAS